jgi:aminomethyltransferase
MCQYEIKQPFWELPYKSLSNNVFEIDYHWFVDFKKDIDYIGKNALYNIKSANIVKKLIGALSDQEISIDSDVILENSVIGKVVDCRFSPGLKKHIAMLFVDKEYAHSNIPMQTSSGLQLTTASAPYVFPSSWSAKK